MNASRRRLNGLPARLSSLTGIERGVPVGETTLDICLGSFSLHGCAALVLLSSVVIRWIPRAPIRLTARMEEVKKVFHRRVEHV